MGEWAWIGRIFESWKPLEIIGVLLALAAAATAVGFVVFFVRRRAHQNGNGIERRRSMPEFERRLGVVEKTIADLSAAFGRHEQQNAQRARDLHAKIETSHRELHDDQEEGFREGRKALSDGLESLRTDMRLIVQRLPTPPGGNHL